MKKRKPGKQSCSLSSAFHLLFISQRYTSIYRR